MLNDIIDYDDTITLVPQTGVQFVEYAFDLGRVKSTQRPFIERPTSNQQSGDQVEYTLLPNWEDDADPDNAMPPHAIGSGDDDYDVDGKKAVLVFLDKWVPVPFLRINPGKDAYGSETYAAGPVDWVRVKVVETAETYGDKAGTHRVIFAFDTALVDRKPNRPYLGLHADDARQTESFRFVHRLKDIASFLSNRPNDASGQPGDDTQAWLTGWLEVLFREAKQARYRTLRAEHFPHRLEHIATYIAFLDFLAKAVTPAKITLVDTVSAEPDVAPIDVDLILDVGNARTCGLLIQSFPNDDKTDLNSSLVMELRDLTHPELVYRDPFESNVELVQAEFGPEDLARLSGRSRAFFWPSLVRLGPEATRLRTESEGTEATTGLSSPKRYLWDVDPVSQAWNFRNSAPGDVAPPIERSVYRFVNNRGDVLEQVEHDRRTLKLKVQQEDIETADALRFSRSSFFTFMLLEILCQATMMINSPATRRWERERHSPRRLRRIVLTMPSATPVQEQRMIRMRTEAAVRLMWSLQGWTATTPGVPQPPQIHTSWDEASSVQLVYLYGEVTQKLGGSIESLFEFLGKDRVRTDAEGKPKGGVPEPSLRIASVDIGAGTTDLMVTTYHQLDNLALLPVQNFREGFRRAGDDLLRLVIERVLIPAVERRLTECGVRNARDLLREKFADDSPGMSELDKHLRRQYVLRLLRPAALGVLSLCEVDDATELARMRTMRDLLGVNDLRTQDSDRIAAYLRLEVERRGGQGFDILDVEVEFSQEVISDCVSSAFERIFANIAEAIHKLDVDVVLLTGRPSCQPAVISLFQNQLGVGIDRIVALRDYRVGNWYPFRAPARSLIADPKTTAVVGGMLCALASGQLTNFRLYTEGLVMRSTARFIGEMRLDGVIPGNKVYFSDVDLDKAAQDAVEAELVFHTAVRLGYRQLDRQDWVASPLYRLRLSSAAAHSSIKGPINVVLERQSAEVDEDATDLQIMNSQAVSEEFKIADAQETGGQERSVKRLMELKFDTSPVGSTDGTYWLDSGILTIA